VPGKLGFPESKNSNEGVFMKKDLLSTEDFEPPSPTVGLGESKVAKNSECPPQVKTQKKNAKIISIQKISSVPRFRTGPRSLAFRKVFFPEVSLAEWNNWRWQLKHRIRDMESLNKLLALSEDEKLALSRESHPLPVAITPYYASLLEKENPAQPVRRTVVPVTDEYFTSPGEAEDPLGEEHDSPVPGLVHRYPDRVLFLVTDFCSTYCRYCTRSRIVGGGKGSPVNAAQWEKAIAYIERTPAVRDVLLSGGDPLTLSDEVLEWLISRVRNIRHVEMLRIGTKVPVVLPQRITPALVRMLKKYHPIWMSIHFTHPDELTPETSQDCERLADGGIPLGSQTVLLSGVNDDVVTMKRLVQGLLKIRVKPYYLYQCDPILGSSHFRTPVEKGLEIIRGLRGFTTGYAVPHYVIDAPGGGGKIPLLPEYFIGRSGDDLLLRNYEGKVFCYPEPARSDRAGRPSEAIDREAGTGP
jgi:lysine 2,3-aminomutase